MPIHVDSAVPLTEADPTATATKRARILVVDDDSAVCRMLEMALDIAGHDVVSIMDARVAISYLESNLVDLVITDLVMPDIEGIEVIMRVSHVHPTIPIVAISGEGAEGPEEYLSIARLLGAHRTLSKPFDCRQLLEVVDQLLAGRN
jgi:two-component system, chemotaxis family, chemotaxis protein CheY